MCVSRVTCVLSVQCCKVHSAAQSLIDKVDKTELRTKVQNGKDSVNIN